MRIEFRQDGKFLKAFVAKTDRGFNKKQKMEIARFREKLMRSGKVLVDGIEVGSVDLLTPLKDLVRVIRNFEVGGYSPIMDELFDAEHAIRVAEGKPEEGIDY
jgi:hypothetical protein